MESRWRALLTTKAQGISPARDEAQEVVRETGVHQALRGIGEESMITTTPLFCIFLMKLR